MDVLVTGAVNEVGRAVAAEFRNAGHRVVITGPNADELEIAAKELEVDAKTIQVWFCNRRQKWKQQQMQSQQQ